MAAGAEPVGDAGPHDARADHGATVDLPWLRIGEAVFFRPFLEEKEAQELAGFRKRGEAEDGFLFAQESGFERAITGLRGDLDGGCGAWIESAGFFQQRLAGLGGDERSRDGIVKERAKFRAALAAPEKCDGVAFQVLARDDGIDEALRPGGTGGEDFPA